jgi:hypothetical protein
MGRAGPGHVARVPVPAGWHEVTARWMTRALGARLPGSVVGAVEVADVDRGTNTRARVHLEYSSGSGPPSVFVKAPGSSGNRLALAALGALFTEARLASSGAALPVDHPTFYAAGTDHVRLGAVVVMHDLAVDGFRPNDATTPLAPWRVRSGLVGLAHLHAAFWGRRLPAQLGFLRPWELGRALSLASTASLARGLRRLDARGWPVPRPRRLDARTLAGQFRSSTILASSSGPRTVLHGDPHPGNTYAAGARGTGFFDWQLARTGDWSHDVGYFLVASLDVDERRRHERSLLAAYLDELGSSGVAAPDWGAAWARYRSTPAFGLATWVHTFSFGSFQPPSVCLPTIGRFAAAYEDLEAGRALSELERGR